MPAIRFTSTLTAAERDSLYVANMPVMVLRYISYRNEKRKNPPLTWYRKQLVFTESVPDCVRWEYDVDHIVPRKMGGSNIPENLIIIPSTMNRSFNKFVDKDKVAFLGKDIFNTATNAIKERVEDNVKEEHNLFGAFRYSGKRG